MKACGPYRIQVKEVSRKRQGREQFKDWLMLSATIALLAIVLSCVHNLQEAYNAPS